MMKRPEGFYLHLDSKGNAEMRVQFRREDVAYIQKAIEIVDDILAMDEEEPRTETAQKQPSPTETNVNEQGT